MVTAECSCCWLPYNKPEAIIIFTAILKISMRIIITSHYHRQGLKSLVMRCLELGVMRFM